MKWHRPFLSCLLASAISGTALAQPADLPVAPATTTEFPDGVSVAELPDGPVYTDSRGHTLYGMDMRTLLRWGPDPSQYCTDQCLETWQPLLAPDGAEPNIMFPEGYGSRANQQHKEKMQAQGYFGEPQKAPDWTVIDGPQGPQWVYKGWHMVFTRRDEKPGSAGFDGAQEFTWNSLKYVPPVPQVDAPPMVTTKFAGGAYAFSDQEGRILFTGVCGDDCSAWEPLAGGFASRGIGSWQVNRIGDRAQWTYRGKPVFVAGNADEPAIPAGATILRPEG
ncbi:MAG: hypothetical protein H6917_02900 [Novosphingobium sp.]|nr:hypothetical protein [Novosphingobium sp.]MCP5401318.1 hypothetical protein [Novosphingobium sp.]